MARKSLKLYQEQIIALWQKRIELDMDFAQALAEAMQDGYQAFEVLQVPSEVKPKEPDYDL